jgi:hypothetical protein
MDRMFRMESGSGTGGFAVDAALSELSSGQVAGRMAALSGSQYKARIAALERSGRGGEYYGLVASGNLAGAAAFITGMGTTDPEMAAAARTLTRDRASLDIYTRRAEQRMDALGISRDDQLTVDKLAVRAAQLQELGRSDVISFGGTRMSGAAARDKYLALPEEIKGLLFRRMRGDLAPDQMAALEGGLQGFGGFGGFMLGAGGATSAGQALYGLTQTDTDLMAARMTAPQRAEFEALQQITSKIGNLTMVRGGVAMIAADLLNPKTDVIGSYLTDGAAGIARLAARSGLVTPGETEDMRKAVAGMNPAQLAAAGKSIMAYDAAVGVYQDKVRSSGEGSDPAKVAREKALAAAADVTRTLGTNVDTDLLKPANERAGSIQEQNLAAVKALTDGISKLTGMLGVLTGAPMNDGDKGGATDSASNAKKFRDMIHVVIENKHPSAAVSVGANDTANASSASGVPTSASAPRTHTTTRCF